MGKQHGCRLEGPLSSQSRVRFWVFTGTTGLQSCKSGSASTCPPVLLGDTRLLRVRACSVARVPGNKPEPSWSHMGRSFLLPPRVLHTSHSSVLLLPLSPCSVPLLPLPLSSLCPPPPSVPLLPLSHSSVPLLPLAASSLCPLLPLSHSSVPLLPLSRSSLWHPGPSSPHPPRTCHPAIHHLSTAPHSPRVPSHLLPRLNPRPITPGSSHQPLYQPPALPSVGTGVSEPGW